MLERERKIAIRLLITGSGVRIPHNPLRFKDDFEESGNGIHPPIYLNYGSPTTVVGVSLRVVVPSPI